MEGEERKGEHTASGLPMSLATEEVASERMAEVSTPSRLTLVERFRQGIFFCDSSLFYSSATTTTCQNDTERDYKIHTWVLYSLSLTLSLDIPILDNYLRLIKEMKWKDFW